MKYIHYLAFFFSMAAIAQEKPTATLVENSVMQVEHIITIDNFGTKYYIDNNILHKKDVTKNIDYSNVQLGEIASANAFNPLKINVFYKDFNTAVILDNRLAEIFKIDFNTIPLYRNVSHISTGNDNTIWIFNQDTQQIELYDYKTNKVRATALPIQSNVLALTSNYNFCWLLTKDYLYQYNYFGSLTLKIKNEGFTKMDEDNGNLILKKENTLYYLKKGKESAIEINTPELLINQFLLTNETLYIYHNETLSEFQLKTN